MQLKPFFFAFLISFISSALYGVNSADEIKCLAITVPLSTTELRDISGGPSPILHLMRKGTRFNRKATAAVLAFPFPFGIVGLHRIYLGSAPYVPVVYIASLGGIFGLLPLIDFIVILTEKDVERFANSGKVFMWVE